MKRVEGVLTSVLNILRISLLSLLTIVCVFLSKSTGTVKRPSYEEFTLKYRSRR